MKGRTIMSSGAIARSPQCEFMLPLQILRIYIRTDLVYSLHVLTPMLRTQDTFYSQYIQGECEPNEDKKMGGGKGSKLRR